VTICCYTVVVTKYDISEIIKKWFLKYWLKYLRNSTIIRHCSYHENLSFS